MAGIRKRPAIRTCGAKVETSNTAVIAEALSGRGIHGMANGRFTGDLRLVLARHGRLHQENVMSHMQKGCVRAARKTETSNTRKNSGMEYQE